MYNLKDFKKERFTATGLKKVIQTYISPDGMYNVYRNTDIKQGKRGWVYVPSNFWYVSKRDESGHYFTISNISYGYSMTPEEAIEKLNLYLKGDEVVIYGDVKIYNVQEYDINKDIAVFENGYMFDLLDNCYRGDFNGSNYYTGGYRGELKYVREDNITIERYINDEFCFTLRWERNG